MNFESNPILNKYDKIVVVNNKKIDFSEITPITSDNKYIYYDYNYLTPAIKTTKLR